MVEACIGVLNVSVTTLSNITSTALSAGSEVTVGQSPTTSPVNSSFLQLLMNIPKSSMDTTVSLNIL
mgnify:FL=1